MVAPAVEAPVVIGLDVGGTKILSGLVDRDGQVLAEHDVPSPDGPEEEAVLAALDAAVDALLDERVQAIGYGIPAHLERGTGRVLWATNPPPADVDVLGRALGAGIASLVNVFDPELVVVGGGFGAAAGDPVLEPACEAVRREAIHPADEKLRIVPAQLGSQAGLVGAGLVAFEALDGAR
jgi:predicted NBD/HSP70 family sugar kinase